MPVRENRKHDRVLAERTVILKVLAAKSSPNMEGSSVFCATEDLSPYGLRLASDRVLPRGAEVDIWIAVQNPPRAYSMLGTVRWVDEMDPPGPHQVGVEFKKRSESEMDEWAAYMCLQASAR